MFVLQACSHQVLLLPLHSVPDTLTPTIMLLALVQVGTSVSDGVRFQWRHSTALEPGEAAGSPEAAAPQGAAGEWRDDLSQLSGGQRSLVALALLLSVSPPSGPICLQAGCA